MNNAFRDKSKDHKSKHYWFRYLLGQGLNNHNLISLSPHPREISQATMMAGSSRWQSAVIGGNGAWRARMRTMNPKSNRTCLYRRSDRGPVLTSLGTWNGLLKSRHHLISRDMQCKFFPHKYLAQHTHANVIHPRYHTGQYIYFLENLILLDKIFTTPPPIMIVKSSFETSPKQPRTTWHHNAAGTSQVALWRHECDA